MFEFWALFFSLLPQIHTKLLKKFIQVTIKLGQGIQKHVSLGIQLLNIYYFAFN